MSSKKGRIHGKNWHPSCINKLAELCAENWEIITAEFDGPGRKSSAGVTQDQKKLCWQTITDKVNSLGDEKRTVGQMKRKFSKIKSRGTSLWLIYAVYSYLPIIFIENENIADTLSF